ncbi:MAG: hypothetical protein LBQ66_05000 [Planctomycetaceae bacterium]|nr:hypothetical protein [Planctomycetaceae bacterium]
MKKSCVNLFAGRGACNVVSVAIEFRPLVDVWCVGLCFLQINSMTK